MGLQKHCQKKRSTQKTHLTPPQSFIPYTHSLYKYFAKSLYKKYGGGIILNVMAIDFKKLERITKGFANKRRLQILDLLNVHEELSVIDISRRLKLGYENTSDHIRKMSIAGLVMKRSDGLNVRHKLTPRAISILEFCKKLK